MFFFSRHDRIAIACIASLIVIGWGIRYADHSGSDTDEIKVIRNAVQPPSELEIIEDISITPVNINTADAQELEKLPMIGPVKAREIVQYRKEHGIFKSIADIKKVHGIGAVTYEKIKDFIKVD